MYLSEYAFDNYQVTTSANTMDLRSAIVDHQQKIRLAHVVRLAQLTRR